MSETIFTPVPLVPDRRLMQRTASGITPVRVLYAKALMRRAGLRSRRGLPSDNDLLAAYFELRKREVAS